MTDVKYPKVKVRLSGHDSSALAIVGTVMAAMKKAGVPKEEIVAFRLEAMSGDYDHLLQTAMKTVDVT
jgi:hypothetical protein